MSATEELTQQIKHSPIFLGSISPGRLGRGAVRGQALSLRKRLASYLPALDGNGIGRLPAKVNEMVAGRRDRMDCYLQRGRSAPFGAKPDQQHRSPFNIRLRDDKSYPNIMITREDEFPRFNSRDSRTAREICISVLIPAHQGEGDARRG
jgi:hypothetical protein